MLRKTLFDVIYQNVNITTDMSPDILSISYTDNEDGQVDDIAITLKDNERKWSGDWAPEKGDFVRLTFKPFNQIALECGKFQVDGITSSGLPAVVEVIAVSVPVSSGVRRDLKSNAWEKTTLKDIATSIAKLANLELMFLIDNDSNPYYEREDQMEESDLTFLHRLCQDEGLSLKVTDSQLVIFAQEMFEEKAPIATLKLGVDEIIRYSFSAQSTDLYKRCTCKYRVPKKRKSLAYTWVDPSVEEGANLKIRKRVASLDEAKRKARAALRRKNRYQTTGSLALTGDTRLIAGVTLNIDGFGFFNGKYLVSKATHVIDISGYTTSIALRRVIEGY
ncbi:MAG: late control D family protein [Candidatus Symbiopectobacterium sp. Dall1.0]|nr:late control D family protein [Candidatus Symbiopectobacterium sp. Dall1.0]